MLTRLYQLAALNARVGIEAVVGIVKASTEYNMPPRLYFSSPQLEEYLEAVIQQGSWDTAHVGAKLEVFAVAGCDIMGKFCSFTRF